MKRKQKTIIDKLRLWPWAIVFAVVVLVLLWASQVRSGRQPMPPELSVPPGFHEEPFYLTLSPAAPGDAIRYTLDGGTPTSANGQVYDGPIRIEATTVLRAAAFRFAAIPSRIQTATYLFLDDVVLQPEHPEGFPSHWRGETVNDREVHVDYGMDPHVAGPDASRVTKALRSLPTLSIVTDVANLFDPAVGIYSNPLEHGFEWERSASIEFYGDSGALCFREDCGLRVQGGASRFPHHPKHGFRLSFRRRYGSPRLRYPLFGGDATDSFDSIVLRCATQDSWSFPVMLDRGLASYIRDPFVRELAAALGQPVTGGRFAHLYLNGLYWGVYNMCERMDAASMVSYFGGTEAQFDLIKDGIIRAGTPEAWLAVKALANANIKSDAVYRDIGECIDFDSLIDFVVLNHYVASEDWTMRNWVVVRRREPGARFVFLVWDADLCMRDVERNWYDKHAGMRGVKPSRKAERKALRRRLRPGNLWQRLMSNEEFSLRFADRVQDLFFNDGALTPEATGHLWDAVAQQLDLAIVAESARWGDSFREEPYTRDVDWTREVARVEESFLSRRREILLSQYRKAYLLPRIEAPTFNQHGGVVRSGFALEIQASGTVYYTLDGTDPRLTGGAINEDHAVAYDGPIVLTQETPVKARVHDGKTWSALCQATFSVESVKTARR